MTLKKAPVITSQPTAITGKIGDAAEFRVGASGTNLKYQWQYVLKGQNNWVNFTNGNACTMKKVLNETYDDLKVRVVITDGNGNSVTSDTVTVTLKKAPVITSQPTAVTGKIGDAAEFRVGASGTNLKYQWQYVLDFDISMPYCMIIVYIKIILAHYSNYFNAKIRCFCVTSKFS